MTLNGLFIISLLTVLVAIITTIAVSHSGGSYLYDQFLRSDNDMGQLLPSVCGHNGNSSIIFILVDSEI
jgi:hypothetical protein